MAFVLVTVPNEGFACEVIPLIQRFEIAIIKMNSDKNYSQRFNRWIILCSWIINRLNSVKFLNFHF